MENKDTAISKTVHIPTLPSGVSSYIADKLHALRLIYGQVLFVWLSFALMALITYFFVHDIMHQHLLKSADDTLSHTQATIASDLAAPAMLLKNVSHNVRAMILNGNSAQAVHELLMSTSESVINDERHKLVLNGVYGYFDVFGGLYLNDGSWTPPADYMPWWLPWYTAAVAAQGEVAATQPYVDARSQGTIVSYSRRIFDDNANPLAVIALDVPIDKIGQYVIETHLAEGGYGVLLSTQLDILAHKDASQIGKKFSSTISSTAAIVDDLKKGTDIFERKMINYRGETSIAFFRPLENGWFLGIITPLDQYYRGVRHMMQFLITLSILLATALSMVLLHIGKAKAKIELAEASNKAKSKFLATMSHEIRTPMNAILGITEIQLQNEMLSQDIKEAFSKIYSSGYTLLNIINDILDLSRIESGKMELMRDKYEVASLISDTAHLNMTRAASKPIAFKLQVDEDMPLELIGDELRIKQILNNLLSNAFKYTKAGEVTLSISAECECRHESPEVTLVCSVSDTGQGMTEEQVRNLFNEYSRFNMDANRMIEGTGLGMNITQHLLHLMRGEIFVESEPGRGSKFTVRLPQTNVGAGVLGRELAEHLRDFDLTMQRMKITPIVREPMPYGSVLIVDDLETNLYVARGLMVPYGLSIDTAMSGFEAIDKIKEGKAYDIVFMDHMMPKMDGLQATKIIRGLGYARPIVALTADAVVGQAEMFLENGFDGFISKPIDIRQLNATLNRLIRDTKPSEVVEAARQQKGYPNGYNASQAVDPQLARIFAREAQKVLAVLEAIYINKCRRDDDVQMFIINVHAMKSALAHVGEAELAAVAHTLEQTGRDKNIPIILAETPAFLDALRVVVEKNTPKDEDESSEIADEDPTYLIEKLLVIQTACAAHDKKTAKNALTELSQKVWSRPVKKQLDSIAEHLLHSDFEEVICITEQTIDGVSP